MQNCNKTEGEKKQDTGRNSGTGFAIYKLQKGKILRQERRRKKCMLQMIEKVLENKVRPKLLEHEGNVEAVEYKEGILKVRLLGQCAGCPSAQLTTEELISDAVRSEIPEVKEVILVHEVSPDLIDMAKKILNHRHAVSGDSYEDRN